MKISKLNKISIIIMPAVVLLLIFPALAQEQLNLNLGNAIDMVLKNNETYQIAQKEVDRADARIIEALATGLPQFTANLQYLRNWEIPSQVVKDRKSVV
jgi:outer membrane protein TolC